LAGAALGKLLDAWVALAALGTGDCARVFMTLQLFSTAAVYAIAGISNVFDVKFKR
jgi:hypothetical protein